MFLEVNHSSYVSGVARGPFLMLVEPKEHRGRGEHPIKACVRSVTLKPCGHWMMGEVTIYGHRITVSGAYGSDGLILPVPQEVYDRLPVTLPHDLYMAWNVGGGWNGAGNEAPAMRAWANENLKALRK